MNDFEIVCGNCDYSFTTINAGFCCPSCGSTECYRKSSEGNYLRRKVRELNNRIRTLEEMSKPELKRSEPASYYIKKHQD